MILNIERNKSLTYFLPLFANHVPIRYVKNIANTYLWYDDYKEDCFCILYKFDGRISGTMRFRQGFVVYEDEVLCTHKLYRGSEDYEGHVIFKFDIPDELFDVRNKFIDGKYSTYEEEDKNTILQFILRNYGVESMRHIEKILTKDKEMLANLASDLGYNSIEKLGNVELSSSPYPEKEFFANSIVGEDRTNINIK